MQEIRHIVLIGAGNVGTHLGRVLKKQGLDVVQVYSRTEAPARLLANELGSDHTTDMAALRQEGDLYILAVSDSAIPDLMKQGSLSGKFIVHTSGSVPMEVLSSVTGDYGVFYPLQTFSADRDVNFRNVPLCIEANSGGNLARLETLAAKISPVVKRVDTEQRKYLHIAAVFACNFPNFMYVLAERLMDRSGLDPGLLKPLILETARKVQSMDPVRAQTGPAIRGDETILRAHLEVLNDQPGMHKIYREISIEIGKMRTSRNDGTTEKQKTGLKD